METLGQRIKAMRKALKMTQKEVAAAIGVTASTITQYELDIIAPKAQPTNLLCKLFNCSSDWLLEGIDTTDIQNQNNVIELSGSMALSRRLPILSPTQVTTWQPDAIHNEDIDEWVHVGNNYSRTAFALKMRGDSMEGKSSDKIIPNGSIVAVEANIESVDLNGKVVVAIQNGTDEAIVKELQIDGATKYLVPWNERFKISELNDRCKIVGFVKEVIIRLHK
jgi:SOS-response transcriptional repressor LexA